MTALQVVDRGPQRPRRRAGRRRAQAGQADPGRARQSDGPARVVVVAARWSGSAWPRPSGPGWSCAGARRPRRSATATTCRPRARPGRGCRSRSGSRSCRSTAGSGRPGRSRRWLRRRSCPMAVLAGAALADRQRPGRPRAGRGGRPELDRAAPRRRPGVVGPRRAAGRSSSWSGGRLAARRRGSESAGIIGRRPGVGARGSLGRWPGPPAGAGWQRRGRRRRGRRRQGRRPWRPVSPAVACAERRSRRLAPARSAGRSGRSVARCRRSARWRSRSPAGAWRSSGTWRGWCGRRRRSSGRRPATAGPRPARRGRRPARLGVDQRVVAQRRVAAGPPGSLALGRVIGVGSASGRRRRRSGDGTSISASAGADRGRVGDPRSCRAA